MANDNFAVDYNDERFEKAESEKAAAVQEVNTTYDGMINQSDKFYQQQIDASKDWADTQTQLQQEQTDFAIEQIKQNKEQAEKDYQKEQSGAYVDWQKQSNQYGAKAEQMAANGLANSGYSESAQVSMYNTYQNRVATARESFKKTVQNFDNAFNEARLQNNAILAEIAFNAQQDQLKLALEGFRYNNSLITEKFNQKTAIDNTYYERIQDVLDQINYENSARQEQENWDKSFAFQQSEAERDQANTDRSFKESQRQFNEGLAFDKSEAERDQANTDRSFKESQRQFNEGLAEDKRQYDQSFKEDQRQFNKTYNETVRSNKADEAYKNGTIINKLLENNPISIDEIKKTILGKNDFMKNATAITRGSRGNTGNGGYKIDGVVYKNYEDYVYKQLENLYNSKGIDEATLIQLLDDYGF